MENATPLPHAATSRFADHDCLSDFVAAWKDEFGEELTEGEARVRLGELVELHCLVAKPL